MKIRLFYAMREIFLSPTLLLEPLKDPGLGVHTALNVHHPYLNVHQHSLGKGEIYPQRLRLNRSGAGSGNPNLGVSKAPPGDTEGQ